MRHDGRWDYSSFGLGSKVEQSRIIRSPKVRLHFEDGLT